MNKPFLACVALAFVALVAIFLGNRCGHGAAKESAEASVEAGEKYLDQARGKSGGGARDLMVKAARSAEDALRESPDLPAALLLLGRAQSAMGESAKACQSFDKLLSLEPENVAGLREGGIAYFERWRLSKDHAHRVEAEQSLQRALSFEPDSARTLFYLGALYHEAGENEARDAIWEKLEKKAPDSEEWREASKLKRPK